MTKKAIRLDEFNMLTMKHQLDVLHQDGVHVGKRVVGDRTVILFQLYTYYVEVYYKQYREEIDLIIGSSSPDMLTPYIDQVQIRDLDRENDAQS